jgi:hypothetical protein
VPARHAIARSLSLFGGAKFFPASHPQQTAHLHAGGRRGGWIERVARIHQRANFSALGGAGKREKQHAGSPRGGRAADFREAPRAKPPVSKSSCGMPLETISGAARAARREAGTTAASLEMALTWAKISAVSWQISLRLFSASTQRRRRRKNKRAAVAAAEKTGEADIHSHNYQGTQSTNARAIAIFAFYSPMKVSLFSLPVVKGFDSNPSGNCNFKTYNALRRIRERRG